MTEDEAFEAIKTTLADVTKMDQAALDKLTPETDLKQESLVDSLDALTIMFELEKNTGVMLPERNIEAMGLLKMGMLAKYIAEHSTAKTGAPA